MSEKYFDDILTRIQTGKWNVIYFLGAGLVTFMIPSLVFAGAFLTPFVEHLCRIPNTEEGHVKYEMNQCSFTVVGTDFNETELWQKKNCSKWDFEHDVFQTSITEEFDLVCDNDYLRPTFQTVYMFGVFIGAPVNGFLADRFGRKTFTTIGVFVGVASVLLSSFVTNFTMLIVLRFIYGLSQPYMLQNSYILCMEVCEPKYRSLVGIVLSLPWAIGTVWWGGLGYFIADWRWLMRVSVIPGLIYILIFIWIIDESPRWLIVRGNHDRTIQILKKAASWNKTTLPPDEELRTKMLEIQMSSISKTEEPKAKNCGLPRWAQKGKEFLNRIFIVYKTPEIRRRTLFMYILYFVGSTVYYGLALNAVNFQVNPYVYMIINGITEIPAYTLPVPVIAKFGRIIPTAISYFICGSTILALAFLPEAPTWLIITLAMIGKFCISSSYQVVFLISTELFPTEVRTQAIGTSYFVSRIGAMIAPYITDSLGPVYPWAPSVLFGSLSLVAGFAILFVPETRNRPLPETISIMEEEARKSKERKRFGNGNKDEEEAEIIVLEK